MANLKIDANEKMGRNYFEMSMKYTNELMKLFDLLTEKVQALADEDIHKANMSQIWALILLVVVMIISPMLLLLAKNANNAVIVSKICKALDPSALKNVNSTHAQFFQDLLCSKRFEYRSILRSFQDSEKLSINFNTTIYR